MYRNFFDSGEAQVHNVQESVQESVLDFWLEEDSHRQIHEGAHVDGRRDRQRRSGMHFGQPDPPEPHQGLHLPQNANHGRRNQPLSCAEGLREQREREDTKYDCLLFFSSAEIQVPCMSCLLERERERCGVVVNFNC